MTEDFEEKGYDWDAYFDEIILDSLSMQVFSGDIKHDDYSPRIYLTSLEYFLLENFEIYTFKELQDLKKKIYGKVIDLGGGIDMSKYEGQKSKGLFRNR